LHTAVLWLGPPVLLLGGGFVLFFFARRKGASAPVDSSEGAELTASEEARLADLLDGGGASTRKSELKC